jgi:hypothetical protein
MAQRHRGATNWPGAGPYSHLPPWQRPGWLYGRGACRYLYYTHPLPPNAIPPQEEKTILTEQKEIIQEQLKTLQEQLDQIQQRLNELNP